MNMGRLSEWMSQRFIQPDDRTTVLLLYRDRFSDRQMASWMRRSRRYVTALRREMGLPDRRGRHDFDAEETEIRMCLNCKKPECNNCLGRGDI